jgi:large subunit ribosomal protein L24
MKFGIRAGDEVQIVRGVGSGRRTKPAEGESDENPLGHRGRVRKVLRAEGRVVVERAHMQKKAVRPDPRKGHRGGFIEREAAIPISTVMLVCRSCDRPVRTGVKENEDGKRVRICRRCGGEV